MLEMEPSKEDLEEDDEYYDEFDDMEEPEYSPDDEDYDEISGMNPEEMLKYIRGE